MGKQKKDFFNSFEDDYSSDANNVGTQAETDSALLSGARLTCNTVEIITGQRFLDNNFKHIETINTEDVDLMQNHFCHIFEKDGKKIAFIPNMVSTPDGKPRPGLNDIRKTLIAYRKALNSNENLKGCTEMIAIHIEHNGKKGGHFTVIHANLSNALDLSPSQRLANAEIQYIDPYPSLFKRAVSNNKAKTAQDAFQSIWGSTKHQFKRVFLGKQYNSYDCGRHASRVVVNLALGKKPGAYQLNDLPGGKKQHRNEDNDNYIRARKSGNQLYAHLLITQAPANHLDSISEILTEVNNSEIQVIENAQASAPKKYRPDKQHIDALIPGFAEIRKIEAIILEKNDWKLGYRGGKTIKVGNAKHQVSSSAREVMNHIYQYHKDAKKLVEKKLEYTNDGKCVLPDEVSEKLNNDYNNLCLKIEKLLKTKMSYSNNSFLQFFGKRSESTCEVYKAIIDELKKLTI